MSRCTLIALFWISRYMCAWIVDLIFVHTLWPLPLLLGHRCFIYICIVLRRDERRLTLNEFGCSEEAHPKAKQEGDDTSKQSDRNPPRVQSESVSGSDSNETFNSHDENKKPGNHRFQMESEIQFLLKTRSFKNE